MTTPAPPLPSTDRFVFLSGRGILNAMLHRYADPLKVTDAVKRQFASAAEQIIDAGPVGFGEIASLHIAARHRAQ